VTYYARVVTSMCARIGLAEEVEATAVSYLKRFYLKNTVMDWHPMNVTYVFPEIDTNRILRRCIGLQYFF
jgi:hypothetical protein